MDHQGELVDFPEEKRYLREILQIKERSNTGSDWTEVARDAPGNEDGRRTLANLPKVYYRCLLLIFDIVGLRTIQVSQMRYLQEDFLSHSALR